MSGRRLIRMKYLAEPAEVSPLLVRRYISMLRPIVGSHDLFGTQGDFPDDRFLRDREGRPA